MSKSEMFSSKVVDVCESMQRHLGVKSHMKVYVLDPVLLAERTQSKTDGWIGNMVFKHFITPTLYLFGFTPGTLLNDLCTHWNQPREYWCLSDKLRRAWLPTATFGSHPVERISLCGSVGCGIWVMPPCSRCFGPWPWNKMIIPHISVNDFGTSPYFAL